MKERVGLMTVTGRRAPRAAMRVRAGVKMMHGCCPRAGGPRRTQLDFQLDISDGGALLTRLGEAELVRGAKPRLAGACSTSICTTAGRIRLTARITARE